MKVSSILLSTNLFEPSRLPSKDGVRWQNPKLSPFLTRDIEEAKNLLVGLSTDNDVANLLEIPVGQLLYILYSQDKNYKTFLIKRNQEKIEALTVQINQ
ncbi:hypothetical protein [Aeromonas salmonicida]|uniref:hypothetical protein n=1 Tax=Aeromonas salmonicida TaxID=645 RepID=UPI00145AB3F1|nr:hypothetical protein [Aeromonas salmonicida]